MNSLRGKALHGLIWNASDKLINQLGYLAVTVFIARLIGPESFGLIGMLTIFMLLAESVISNGFAQALIQRSEKLTNDDASTIFYVNLGWGLLTYALLYLCAPSIASFYNQPELVDISRVLFLVILLNSLTVVARAKLTINIDFKSQTISSTFATLLSSIIGVVLALKGYSYWALVWLLILKSALNTLALWFFCRWAPKLVFSTASFKLLFGFGSKLMLAGLVATFVNNLYVALIGRYYNATQVGYFTQASNLSTQLATMISSTLQGVTFPILSSIQEDRARLINIYKQLISLTMLISLPLIIGFAAVSEHFVVLALGDDWLPVVPVLKALCFAFALRPISAINMNILNAIGRSDLFLKVDLVKLPIVLGTLFIALPYGINGLAIGMIVNAVISFLINGYYPWKLFSFGALKQLKTSFHYIFAVALMYAILSLFSLDSLLLDFFVKVPLGALVYGLTLILFRDPFLKSIINRGN